MRVAPYPFSEGGKQGHHALRAFEEKRKRAGRDLPLQCIGFWGGGSEGALLHCSRGKQPGNVGP